MFRTAVATACLLTLDLVLTNPANAEPKIGKAAITRNQVEGILDGPPRALAPGSAVFSNELVRTGDGGVARLLFLDNTDLAVGPKSEVLLDKFVYDPKGSVGSLIVQVGRGAFRFVTGKQDHNNYSINTPYATLGVRGTIFEVVSTLEKVDIHLVNGGLQVRTFLNQVIELAGAANSVSVLATGEVIGPFTAPANSTILDFDFALARLQGGLDGAGGPPSFMSFSVAESHAPASNEPGPGPPDSGAAAVAASSSGPTGGVFAANPNFLFQPNFCALACTITAPPVAVAVPGPIAGAGIPGLVVACGSLLAWATRRRRTI
jgi:hypothetical protein